MGCCAELATLDCCEEPVGTLLSMLCKIQEDLKTEGLEEEEEEEDMACEFVAILTLFI